MLIAGTAKVGLFTNFFSKPTGFANVFVIFKLLINTLKS